MLVDRVDPSPHPRFLAEAEVKGDLDQDRLLRGKTRLPEDGVGIGARRRVPGRLDWGEVIGVAGGLVQRHLAPVVQLDETMYLDAPPGRR